MKKGYLALIVGVLALGAASLLWTYSAERKGIAQPQKARFAMPEGPANIFWVSSVPIGLKVYLAPISERANNYVEEKYFKGVTPLAIKLEPGDYVVGVLAPLNLWEDLKFYEDQGFPVTDPKTVIPGLAVPGAKTSPEEQDRLLRKLMQAFERDGDVLTFDTPVGETRFAISSEGMRIIIESVNKEYRIKKKAGEPLTLISLFQRRSMAYSALFPLLPEGTNFQFKDEALRRYLLRQLNIPSSDQEAILEILHRGGKVVIEAPEDAELEANVNVETGVLSFLKGQQVIQKVRKGTKVIVEKVIGPDQFRITLPLISKPKE